MKKLALLVMIFVIGCGASNQHIYDAAYANANTWVGAHIDDAIVNIGPPNGTHKLENGNTVYSWQASRSYQQGGGAYVMPQMNFSKYGTYMGPSYSIQHKPATSQLENCGIILVVNKDKIIMGGKMKGGCPIPAHFGQRRSFESVFPPLASQDSSKSITEAAKGKWALKLRQTGGDDDCSVVFHIILDIKGDRGSFNRVFFVTAQDRLAQPFPEAFNIQPNGSFEMTDLDKDGNLKQTWLKGHINSNGIGSGTYDTDDCEGVWEAYKLESY